MNKIKSFIQSAYIEKAGSVCYTSVHTGRQLYVTAGSLHTALLSLLDPFVTSELMPLLPSAEMYTHRDTRTHRAFTIQIPSRRRKQHITTAGWNVSTDRRLLFVINIGKTALCVSIVSSHQRQWRHFMLAHIYAHTHPHTHARPRHIHSCAHNQSVWVMCWQQWAIPKRLLFSERGEALCYVATCFVWPLLAYCYAGKEQFHLCSKWLQCKAKHIKFKYLLNDLGFPLGMNMSHHTTMPDRSCTTLASQRRLNASKLKW